MSDEQVVGRRTRQAGAAAGVVAVAAVVVAVLAALLGAPGTDGATPQDPTVAAATASASPSATSAAASGAGSDAAPSSTPAAPDAPSAPDLPREVREVVDVVLELESGTQVAPPVGLGDGVEVLPGVRVAVDGVAAVDGQAVGPGESSGPALALDVSITNDSGAAVSADGLVVNVYGTDAVPGSQLLGDPRSAPLQGDIAGGTSVQGVYVLTGPGGSTTGPHVVSLALGAGSTTALVVLTLEAG